MRILLLPWNYFPNIGGVETCVYNISMKLINKDIKTVIVTARNPKDTRKVERINGIFVFRIYPHLFWSNIYKMRHPLRIILRIIINFPNTLNLIKIIKVLKIDIINLHYLSPAAIYIFLIAKILRIKIIASLHGELTQSMRYGTVFEKWLFKILLRRADFITVCSEDLLKDTLFLYPCLKNRNRVIINGVNLKEFDLNFEYDFEKKYILSMGSLYKHKGFDLLINAFSCLVEKQYDINLIIAGTGLEKTSLEKFAKLLKIENKIIFYGAANGKEKIKLFNECEFFVLPSRIEPFGIVNLEAMAAGKAIVATRTGGVPEIVKDGVNGILVEPYNNKALAEGMMRLLDNKELRERLGRNGRKMVEDPKFSWDNITEQYIDTYKKVLQEK